MREVVVSVEVHGPGVGLVVQEAVQAGGAPDPVAPGTGDAGLHETDRDLAHGKPVIGVPVENLAHDGGLFLVDLKAWGQSVGSGKFAIPEGHVAGHDRPLPGPPQLSSTVAFDDLGSLELGYCRLDLRDETTVRAVGEPALKEDHWNAKATELIEHQGLVDIVTGQPVGTQHDHGIDQPGGCRVAHPVQSESVQPHPGIAVVGAAQFDLPTFGRHFVVKGFELGTDSLLLFLTVG
jgi:hypothetical protein